MKRNAGRQDKPSDYYDWLTGIWSASDTRREIYDLSRLSDTVLWRVYGICYGHPMWNSIGIMRERYPLPDASPCIATAPLIDEQKTVGPATATGARVPGEHQSEQCTCRSDGPEGTGGSPAPALVPYTLTDTGRRVRREVVA